MAEVRVEKVAVVTGGASGIGLGIAERLAHDGAKVAIFDLDGDAADTTAAKITADGGTAIGVAVDVGDRAAIEQGLGVVRDSFGPVTILVNNAGMEGRSEEHTSELQSLMRISYAVFCLKKKRQHTETT